MKASRDFFLRVNIFIFKILYKKRTQINYVFILPVSLKLSETQIYSKWWKKHEIEKHLVEGFNMNF